MLDKLDVYRISDPVFRVHTRLFRVQEAILRSSRQQIRASKLAVVSRGAAFSAFVVFVLTLIVVVFDVKWSSAPVIVLIGIGIATLLVHAIDYVGLRETEQDFDNLITSAGGEDAETWTDYSENIIAAYGTRLKMIADAQRELEQAHANGNIDEQRYQTQAHYFAQVTAYCTERLDRHAKLNQELYETNKRSKEDYESVESFLKVARTSG